MDIVAVDGFEPPTQPLTASSKPTELYGKPFFLYCLLPSTKPCEAATPRFCLCRHYPSPAIWAHALLVLALRSLDLRSLNTPLLPWLIRPTSLMSHSSLGLTLLPICPVCCDSVATMIPSRGSYRFGNYLVTSGCTYGLSTVSFHSLSVLVSFDAVSWRSLPLWLPRRYHPPCYIISAYLPGLHAARPLAFVEGAGFEPAAHLSISGNHRMRYGV